jgi:uncharacterized membrane protein YbhN (UPF0104 family)
MKSRAWTVVRWAVALAAIGLLASLVDLGAIRTRLAATDPRLAIAGVVGLVLVQLVPAATWRRLLRSLAGVSLNWSTTLRVYYGAQVFGTVTPGNVGADVYRVVALGQGAGRVRLAQAVLVQRITSVLAILCLGAIGALALPIAGLGSFLAGVAVVGAIFACCFVAVLRLGSGPAWLGALARRVGWGSDGTPRTGRIRSALFDGIGLGLVFHAMSLCLGLLLVRAVDPAASADPLVVLGALAVARVSLAVPISPNGIGVQEGLLAILFVRLGLPAETAIAAALLNRLGFLATAGIGLIGLAWPAPRQRIVVAQPSRRARGQRPNG